MIISIKIQINYFCNIKECKGTVCELHDMKQCYLSETVWDKTKNNSILCDLACTGGSDYENFKNRKFKWFTLIGDIFYFTKKSKH